MPRFAGGIIALSSRSTLTGSVWVVRPEPAGETEHMRVDGEARQVERHASHDVRGLAADARDGHEVLHRSWHLAVESLDEGRRHPHEALGLVVEEAGRSDDLLELGGVGDRERLGRRVAAEEPGRDHVHALIGALRGEDRRREELEGTFEVERTHRVRILLGETPLGLERSSLRSSGPAHRGRGYRPHSLGP